MAELQITKMRALTWALGMLVSVLVLALAATSASASIRLGVYVASQGQEGAPESAQVLDSYANMVGRKPDIVMDYSNVTEPLLSKTDVANLKARGETPLITWQLFQSGWSGATISLADIAAGRYDTYLKQAAEEAREMPFSEIMIRFGHEMNGNWYGWSGDPANFVAAWRHVVSIFREAGASNVKWVWSANVDNGSYPFAAYFPGDAWVDYVALDGYNWGQAGIGVNRWQSLEAVFASSYAQLTQLSSKPVILSEVSSSEVGGDKAAWIREGLLKTVPQKFPRVQAVVWYDRSQEEDWRIDSSPASLAAYREVVESPLYGGAKTTPAAPEVAVESLQVTPTETVPAPATQKPRKVTPKKRSRAAIAFRLSRSAPVALSIAPRGRAQGATKLSLTLAEPRQSGRVDLSKLIGGRRLRRGAYVVTATAIEADGSRSRPRQAEFRVLGAVRS